MKRRTHLLEDDVLDPGTHYTELRPSLFGSFNLSNSRIPYVQTIFTLKDVIAGLQLVENLPSDLRAKWSFEELFQREIDWERVKNELFDGYLKQQNKLKFFNALTVALLPLNKDGKLDSKYGDTPTPPPLPGGKPESFQISDIGGVQLVQLKSRPISGYIRWDDKRIFAATIDGQHRLAALKMLAEHSHLTQEQLNTSVAITVLVLDERAGLQIDQSHFAEGDNPLLKIVREVFIDLNKHAIKIVRAREILLDDQAIEAVCLRSLLAHRVGDDTLTDLPLGIVHWQHKVTAKFNTGASTAPFITTIELLNLILEDFLDLKTPKDPLDEEQVRKYINSIEDILQVSNYVQRNPNKFHNWTSLTAYAEAHNFREGFEEPFVNPPPRYVRACAEAFAEAWKPLFVKIFLAFTPYKEFIDKVRAAGGIDGDLAYYMVLPEKQMRTQREAWGEKAPELIEIPQRELASQKLQDWPFFAVFQKALFRATKTAALHYEVLPAKKRELPFADQWLEFLNEMWDRGLFAVKAKKEGKPIWVGIGVASEGLTVKWSEAAVTRISSVILLWWYFYVNDLAKPGIFIKRLCEKGTESVYPGACNAWKQIVRGLTPVFKGGEKELEEGEITKLVDARLHLLLTLAKSKHPGEVEETEQEPVSEAVTAAEIHSAEIESDPVA
jgi:hypothetical protein